MRGTLFAGLGLQKGPHVAAITSIRFLASTRIGAMHGGMVKAQRFDDTKRGFSAGMPVPAAVLPAPPRLDWQRS
jgi:hypothetical protein